MTSGCQDVLPSVRSYVRAAARYSGGARHSPFLRSVRSPARSDRRLPIPGSPRSLRVLSGPAARARGKSASKKRPPTPPQQLKDSALNKAQPRENLPARIRHRFERAAAPRRRRTPQESVRRPRQRRRGWKRAAAFAGPFPRYLFLQDRDGRAPDESDHLINPLGKERANRLDSRADGTHEFLQHAVQVRLHSPAAARLRRALHRGCQDRKLRVTRQTAPRSPPRRAPRGAESRRRGSGSGRKTSPDILHPQPLFLTPKFARAVGLRFPEHRYPSRHFTN